MSYINTIELKDFNVKEVAELLEAYNNQSAIIDGLTVNLNKHSGTTWISDSEYNEFMVNPETDNLEQYMHCGNCGHQEFQSSLEEIKTSEERLEDCSCPVAMTDQWQWEVCECGAFNGYSIEDEDYPQSKPLMCSSCEEGRLFPVW